MEKLIVIKLMGKRCVLHSHFIETQKGGDQVRGLLIRFNRWKAKPLVYLHL